MYSERNICVSKVKKLQGVVGAITTDLNSTSVKKEEVEDQIQQLKSVV